jgi:branched-chain amino acid transport system permease protein
MTLHEFVQQCINGLSLGSTYALLALGLAMLFSIMGLINFAHGELLTIGGYVMWTMLHHDVSWILVVPATLLATTLSAVAMERIAFRPLRGASIETLLVTSFALAFFIQTVLQIAVSAEPEAIKHTGWSDRGYSVGPYTIGLIQIITTAVTFAVLAALVVFLRRTLLGVSIRAAAEDFAVVRLMGIPAGRVVVAAFALSGLLAGIAALLFFASAGSVSPTSGTAPIVAAFIAVVLGGLGNLTGAVVGGYVLGFADQILAAVHSSTILQFHDAVVLAILIGLLLLRPQGLVGRRQELA